MKLKNKSVNKDEFRKNKKSGHPAYIYKKVGNDYEFIGITHSKITDRVKNIKLNKNPNPKDKRLAYFRPKAEKEKTNKFGKKLVDWVFGKKDKEKIKPYKSTKK